MRIRWFHASVVNFAKLVPCMLATGLWASDLPDPLWLFQPQQPHSDL